MKKAIGVFDSGYGGLTILSQIVKELPNCDFVYLGDNARSPYGNRSFDVVYEFTLQAVEFLFKQNCDLVILACNTASAKALRSIQQNILPLKYPNKRVLGVIRPTSEILGNYSKSKHIGLVATEGTVNSQSYQIEINKFFPDCELIQKACPIWVPLIENNIHLTEGGKWFIKKDIEELLDIDPKIDTILLACTHYPIVSSYIKSFVSENISVISQGEIVAKSLKKYLIKHDELGIDLDKTNEFNEDNLNQITFYTTENEESFNTKATLFFNKKVFSKHIKID